MEDRPPSPKTLRVMHLTANLIDTMTERPASNDHYHYIYNDGIHRIAWTLLAPAEQLLHTHITVTVRKTAVPASHLTLPEYEGRKHTLVQMVVPPTDTLITNYLTLAELLRISPRNRVTGRKPISEDSVIIRAAVPREMASLFLNLGNGSMSRGIRRAGKLIMKVKNPDQKE